MEVRAREMPGARPTKSFVNMPEWFRRMETEYKPMMENSMNEMMLRYLEVSARIDESLDRVRDAGIEFAIQRYGLRAPSDNEEEEESQPSTSRRPSREESAPKRFKPEPEEQVDPYDIMHNAIQAAISDRGVSTLHTR